MMDDMDMNVGEYIQGIKKKGLACACASVSVCVDSGWMSLSLSLGWYLVDLVAFGGIWWY